MLLAMRGKSSSPVRWLPDALDPLGSEDVDRCRHPRKRKFLGYNIRNNDVHLQLNAFGEFVVGQHGICR